MAAPVALILGAGPRVGASVAKKFGALGYKVALASRKGTDSASSDGFFSVQADLSKPDTVPAVFGKVQSEFHAPPSVVIYNAATLTPPPVEGSPLSIPAEAFVSDLNLNAVSAYVAGQQAAKGWEDLPKDAKKTFIYTGNILNVSVLPPQLFLTLGVGKSASAYWVAVADAAYAGQVLDQRGADGSAGMNIDGDAHADFFEQLATHEGNVPWHATFVKGKGYVKF